MTKQLFKAIMSLSIFRECIKLLVLITLLVAILWGLISIAPSALRSASESIKEVRTIQAEWAEMKSDDAAQKQYISESAYRAELYRSLQHDMKYWNDAIYVSAEEFVLFSIEEFVDFSPTTVDELVWVLNHCIVYTDVDPANPRNSQYFMMPIGRAIAEYRAWYGVKEVTLDLDLYDARNNGPTIEEYDPEIEDLLLEDEAPKERVKILEDINRI